MTVISCGFNEWVLQLGLESLSYFAVKVIFLCYVKHLRISVNVRLSTFLHTGEVVHHSLEVLLYQKWAEEDIHYTYNKLSKLSHCIIYISLSYIQPSGLITLSNNWKSVNGSWNRALTASASWPQGPALRCSTGTNAEVGWQSSK